MLYSYHYQLPYFIIFCNTIQQYCQHRPFLCGTILKSCYSPHLAFLLHVQARPLAFPSLRTLSSPRGPFASPPPGYFRTSHTSLLGAPGLINWGFMTRSLAIFLSVYICILVYIFFFSLSVCSSKCVLCVFV